MKSNHRIILFIFIGIALLAVAYFFRENLWVALSSVWAGAMILFGKVRSFFTGGSTSSSAELAERLSAVRQVEKELIDALMKEREVFQSRISQLEGEGRAIQQRIETREQHIARIQDFDTWEDTVWDELSPEEQQARIEENFGEVITMDEFFSEDFFSSEDM